MTELFIWKLQAFNYSQAAFIAEGRGGEEAASTRVDGEMEWREKGGSTYRRFCKDNNFREERGKENRGEGSSESKHPGFGVTTGDSIREKNMWISESELEDGDTDSEPIQKTCISESNLVVDNTSPAHHTKQKRVDSTVPKRKDITQVSELNACERTVEQAHVDRTDPGDAEDDAFKLVREIFFTS
ncbi:uncharacterized protein LOC121319646 isoform X3 [Polyodon spathula]|uniref:uncharacterized protein LOC121319646 isoform X3 n=1 Tax=Polyodon spathula TaxID=7913 RepID=UPI001B7ECA1C|nr:uncharacterized protein LOC121319646 isoform X3 [Polyodon spathula]